MYTEKDFENIDENNYNVCSRTAYHIILKSTRTGHFWDIECRELHPGTRQLVIYHKHNENDAFHEQPNMHPKTVDEAQDMIKRHDEWFLEKKNGKKGKS